MNDPQQICEHMCRACMCKNQTLHSLFDETAEKSLTIYEMLATMIPQVPGDSNDELPKKICAACLNILIIVHKFQQMCIASDTYMRSVLVSSRLARDSSITEHQEEIKQMAMALETEKLDMPLETQDLHQLPSVVKVETNDEAVNESVFLEAICSQEIDTIPLKTTGNLKLGPIEKDEFQDCIKFEESDMETQECDLMTNLKSETVLMESRDVHHDVSIAAVLDPYKDSTTNSQWNDDDNSVYQKKSTYTVSKSEQQQPSISSVTKEIDVYEIEKPNSSSHVQYKFSCPHCDAKFCAESVLKKHSHVHDRTRRFSCEACNYRFQTKKGKMSHYELAHKMTPPGGFKCPKCTRRFEKRYSLCAHMKTHSVNNYIFNCDICPKKFGELEQLTRHLRKHKRQKFLLEKENDKSRHQKKSTSNETDCSDIEKPNSNEQNIFPCPHCDAVFSNNYKLKHHSNLHDEIRQFVCEVCNYRFETCLSLANHKKIHKMTPPGGFKCTKCPRRFEKKNSLSGHMKSHSECIIKCDLCSKKFVKLKRLTIHLEEHKSQEENENDSMDKNFEQNIGDGKKDFLITNSEFG